MLIWAKSKKYSGPARCARGYVIAEAAASLVFILPLVFILFFAAAELVQAYCINTVLTQAANQAARQLAVVYPDNSTTLQYRSYQDSLVYGGINYNGIIANSAQFDDAVFNTTADPPTVTVTVHYTGGQYGLSPFPAFDPLGIGKNFQLASTSVYKLEAN